MFSYALNEGKARVSGPVIDDLPGRLYLMGPAMRWWGSKFNGMNNANSESSYPVTPKLYPCQGECDNESKIFAFVEQVEGEIRAGR